MGNMKIISGLLLLLVSSQASAYVGPGLGLGVIGAIFGFLGAIFLAVIGLFWYPLKRRFKKIQSSKVVKNKEQEVAAEDSSEVGEENGSDVSK